MDGTHLTWHRLLATGRALYDGASFEDMRLPAYGGSLFDPSRFPFLSATTDRGTLAVTVSDRVMLHVLRAVQVARPKGQDARRISFRDIDVEQIGYIYEGLLGYTCRRADQIVLGLPGREGDEPEVPLTVLDDLAEDHPDDTDLAQSIIDWAKQHQPAAKPPSKSALAKALTSSDTLEDADRALLAVTRDPHLHERLRPWIGAVRRDLRGRPMVVLDGGLYVAETPSRKNAGAHYTPRALAEEVVEHALEPLVYSPGPHQTADRTTWRLISSDDLLDLRVADIACGSGAFLVAAARFLAARLVEAWRAEGTRLSRRPKALETDALRKVVARCLYGADINAMAVEMCKLSLWLVSLDRDLPFSFVDDKILHGNSLLGLTDLDQLRELHIYPADARAGDTDALFHLGSDPSSAGRMVTDRVNVDEVIERVKRRRTSLATEVSETDLTRTAAAKHRIMAQIDQDLTQLTTLADAVVAAGLPLGAPRGRDKQTTRPVLSPDGTTSFAVDHIPDPKLQAAYQNLVAAAGAAFPSNGTGDPTALHTIINRGLTPTVVTDDPHWKCLHWALVVPDVLDRGRTRSGFDAIIGNPPFLGGKKMSGALGGNIREWNANVLAGMSTGQADLVASFFLRAFSLLGPSGTMGLVATNTIAQGDTREVGLDQMVASGFQITRSIRSKKWPSSSANIEYAVVWGTRSPIDKSTLRVADDTPVPHISTLLEPAGRVSGKPVRLTENASMAFKGMILLGDGFCLPQEQAEALIVANSAYSIVLLPYVIGEDLNSHPDHGASTWVIDVSELALEEANRDYPLVMNRIRTLVKPIRDEDPIKQNRDEWWRYQRRRPALRKAVHDLNEVLAITIVSKVVMPVRVPARQILSHATVIFATESYADQAVLSSSLHQMWSIKYGSGMRTDPRYTPSDVFETFPRPTPTNDLGFLGRTLDTERREIMLRRDLGLTKLYNLINDPTTTPGTDPDVDRLRQIHTDLDTAVMAAYGWSDVPLDHGFHTYRQMTRWTVSPAARTEILDRLLEENHRRSALESNPQPATE